MVNYMILRTSIYNHNYYPIKLYNLEQQILTGDNESVHDKFAVHDTSFNDDLGILIKPFQDAEYFTIIEPDDDLTKFDGDIVFEQIIKTDSYDYSEFGNLSKQHYNLNKRPVMVKLDNYSRTVSGYIDPNTFTDIEFNMKGIDEWTELEKYLKTFNLEKFEIEEVAFYGEGIHATELLEDIPDECGIYGYKRAMVCPELFTSDIVTLCDNSDGSYKVQIDQKENDVQCKLRISGSIYNLIISKISVHQHELFTNAPPLYLPVYTFPVGMSIILNLSPKHRTPYKLNLKVYTNISFIANVPLSDENGVSDEPAIAEFIKMTLDPSFNRNMIMPSPAKMKIHSHPSDYYTGQVKIFMYPFKNYAREGSQEETEMIINDVSQKTEDVHTANNDVTLTSDAIPSRKIIPQDEKYLDRNPFNIFVDTINLTEDYSNSIMVDFTYNEVDGQREVPINIYPNLTLDPKLVLNDFYQSDSGIYLSGEQEKKDIADMANQPKLNTHIGHTGQTEYLSLVLYNTGNTNAKIDKVEFIDINDYETAFAGDADALLKCNVLLGGHHADTLKYLYAILPDGEYVDSNKEYDPVDYDDKGKITDYLSFKIDNIKNENTNLNGLNPIILTLKVNRLNPTENKVLGKVFIIKITYNDGKYIFTDSGKTSFRILNTQVSLAYEKSQDITYVKPRVRSTIFLKLFKTTSNSIIKGKDFGNNGAITDVKLMNYDNNEDTYITDNEFIIDKTKIPFSLLSSQKGSLFSFDLDLTEERLYQFKVRLYTNIPNIPFIDVPYEIICTTLDAEQAIKFDESDFYVRNNKYFLSLNINVPKSRTLNIKNVTDTDIIVNDIKFDLPTSQLGMTDMLTEQINNITLPYKLTNKNPIKMDFDFQGREYGRSTGFIILSTDLGEVYLPVVIFVNTKLKDVMVLMENARGIEFIAPLNSVDKEFIKLTNFGEDLSLIDVIKLGYDKNEFLVENNVILFPNTINYVETMFTPTSTGKKIGFVDIKIKDMLETFVLRNTDYTKQYKTQNTHIIAELMGNAMSDHALPQFSKSVVDFGFLAIDKKDRTMRYDTFEIKNLGLTPFIITSITKLDNDSPFMIPLAGQNLPIKVDTNIQLPIQLNNKKLTNNTAVYTDMFKFEMQDLKSKRMFTYDIIVKIELTDVKREYFSFNSDYINFGYCQINHFKTDEVTVKNYSTNKVVLNINTNGDVELQSLENMTINLQPSQTFDIPVYFYPHGISEFSNTLVLDFDNGNYIKEISLHGLGVDFNSPLVSVENKLAEYYKNLVNHLGKPKYI